MKKEMAKLNVALVGSSQLSFPGDKEAQYARSAREMAAFAEKLGFALWVYEKQVITEQDAEEAAAAVKAHNADFLLLQCTSFSAGYLAPVFARIPGVRLGLWAIDETSDEGVVPFNSFCSINMYAGIIGHYVDDKLPFKWFYGNAGNPLLDRRLEVTIRALTAIKNLNTSKVALVGGIAPGFNDLYFDERTLARRFPGLKYNRLHEVSEITNRAKRFSSSDIAAELKRLKAHAEGAHPAALEMLETDARVYLALRELIDKYGYDAIGLSCWPHFQQAFDKVFSVCSVVGRLNDDGIVTACEGDPLSAVSMLMLKYMANADTMLMDLSAFDEKDDTVLMWHCGPAASCFAGEKGYTLGVNYSGAPHVKGEPPKCAGVARDMVFGEQHVTIARLTGEIDKMLLLEGDFTASEKKSFFGSRGWLGGLKMNREPISARDLVNTVLVRKFQHHFPIVGGDYSREVLELCAWLGLGTLERAPYQDYLQV